MSSVASFLYSQAGPLVSPHTIPYESLNPESSAAFNRERGSISPTPGGADVIHFSEREKGSNLPVRILSVPDDRSRFNSCIHSYHKFDHGHASEVMEYMNREMLQLARMSRDACNAKIQYNRLRAQELEKMRSLVEDEIEASQACLTQVERQIGQIRKRLYASGGMASIDINQRQQHWSSLFRGPPSIGSDSDESEVESSYHGSECSFSYHNSVFPPSSSS